MSVINMPGRDFVGLLQPAIDLVHGDDDPKVYIDEVAEGGLRVRAAGKDTTYVEAVPDEAKSNYLVRSSWYFPDWFSEMILMIESLHKTDCAIELLESGLRVLIRGGSGQALQYHIATHTSVTYLVPGSTLFASK